MILQKINLMLPITFLLNLSLNLISMEITYTPKDLITNTVQYLTAKTITIDAFDQDANNLEATITTNQHELTNLTKNYKALIKKYEQTCPLFFLNECTKEIGNIALNDNCLLSRIYKPHIRQTFEKHASKLLLKKLQTSPTTNTVYTSFGCGGAFQDLIIITKALIKQPEALLTIHLIDGNNTSYVTAVNFLNHSREITIDHEFNFGFRLAEYEQYARNKELHDPEIQAMSNHELAQQLTLGCIDKETQYKQLLSWLMQQFPSSHISLYLHDDIVNYCDFIKNNNLTHADVLTAADIEDDESRLKGGSLYYSILCAKTLIEKPASVNAWLRKVNNNSVGISTASLTTPKQKNIFWTFDEIKL